jgi:hypothetical protein
MRQFHVISVSIGTGILFCMLTIFIVLGIAAAIVESHSNDRCNPEEFHPNTGAMGEIEHQMNDFMYGPVNSNATREVKNGLFGRIRANRQARICQPVSQQTNCLPTQHMPSQCDVAYSKPIQAAQPSYRVVDPSDCTYSYAIANPVVGQTIDTQPTGIEMPSVVPVNPLEHLAPNDCPNCKSPKRETVKTGSFICSNCRQSQVGGWHTDWKEDGTPITFLCERCYSLMSPEHRERAYKGYIARQSKTAGISGLLHQEIGQ